MFVDFISEFIKTSLDDICFEKVRGQSEGGGLMTLVHNSLNPVLIPTKSMSKMSLNVLVVETIKIIIKTRFINAYGVQETASLDEKCEFFLY